MTKWHLQELQKDFTAIGIFNEGEGDKLAEVQITSTKKKQRGRWFVGPIELKNGEKGGIMELASIPLSGAAYRVFFYLLSQLQHKSGNLALYKRSKIQEMCKISSRTTLREAFTDLYKYNIIMPARVNEEKFVEAVMINPRFAFCYGLGAGMEDARKSPGADERQMEETPEKKTTLH